MKIFYDWEFLEDGRTIEPISLGMVAEDGRELYVVFDQIMMPSVYMRICKHRWLMENVIPHLPLTPDGPVKPPHGPNAGSFRLDRKHPSVLPKTLIRDAVRNFMEKSAPVQLWGYYSSYDHVALAQLFGPMVDRPYAMPMITMDIVQLCAYLGRSELGLPPAPQDAHNALSDARWVAEAYRHLHQG